MHYRSYYSQPVYPPDDFYQNPYAQQQQQQQLGNPYAQLNGPPLQQTPYEQFAKPQQPMFWNNNSMQTNADFNPSANPVPPNQANPQNPQNGGFMNYFQDKDGQVDFDKMLSTVGQLANTYHQVSPIVKQFGSIIKNFK